MHCTNKYRCGLKLEIIDRNGESHESLYSSFKVRSESEECDPSCEDELPQYGDNFFIDMLVRLMVVLFVSNKKSECKIWIRQNMSQVVSLTTKSGDSILDRIVSMQFGCLSREALMRVFVLELKMYINANNIERQTPLHLFSRLMLCEENGPSQDMKNVAELLMKKRVHMDSVDIYGNKACLTVSPIFPMSSFIFRLECLATKTILKHGINYEKPVPPHLIPMIESHKL